MLVVVKSIRKRFKADLLLSVAFGKFIREVVLCRSKNQITRKKNEDNKRILSQTEQNFFGMHFWNSGCREGQFPPETSMWMKLWWSTYLPDFTLHIVLPATFRLLQALDVFRSCTTRLTNSFRHVPTTAVHKQIFRLVRSSKTNALIIFLVAHERKYPIHKYWGEELSLGFNGLEQTGGEQAT